MKRLILLLVVASLSFSIELRFLINTGLNNATAFEPFNNKFYVINDFDGRIYTFDLTGGLINKIKAKNLYLYDIDSFGDTLIYLSDLGVYRLKPSIKELSKIYGFNSLTFNNKFYVFGTVYHALVSYDSNFSFINKIGGVNQPNELVVEDLKLINTTLFVSDVYNNKILILDPSLHKIDECNNINISVFDVLNESIVGYSNNSIIVLKNCSVEDSLPIDNVKDIEYYNGEIYILINNSIYKLNITTIKQINEEEVNEEINQTNETIVEKEQNLSKENKTIEKNQNNKIKKESEEMNEEENKQISELVVVGVILIILLSIVYIFLRPKRKYRRRK